MGRGGGGGDGGACGQGGGDRLTVLSLEIHVQVGASRRPDPRRDPVHAVCWSVKDAFSSAEREVVRTRSGIIVLPLATPTAALRSTVVAGASGGGSGGAGTADEPRGGAGGNSVSSEVCLKCGEVRNDDGERKFCTFEGGGGYLGQGIPGGGREGEGPGRRTFCHGLGKGVEVLEVCSESQVMRALVGVFCRHDPDFVAGWEVQGDSLGYLVERGLNLVSFGFSLVCVDGVLCPCRIQWHVVYDEAFLGSAMK